MKKITSKENQIFKLCSKLTMRKHRDQEGLYLIEGEKLVREAIESGQRIKVIAVAESSGLRPDFSEEIVFMEDKLFTKLAQTKTTQGILAVVETRELTEEEFLKKTARKSGNVVLLDRLQDPGNIGTIIRTADAAGYSGVMTIKGTADLYSLKIVRAAAGSLFRMPVFSADSPSQAVSVLEAAGKTIFATGFDTDLYYYDVDMKRNIGLIIGNEGNGISPELMAMAHRIIKIPMDGDIDSLNASVAAGILMYESMR
ncbi:MAG: RNA methyltransferase [Clostridiales Family XIII bacterium]|uniref:RNA methyltransferase n=1 Tax=Hominibacterium faecale TaxID=2839743 RepID=A0A9J6QRM1_9FIRM|nr:RNA methyltransferase [Hominibacterium faecale]MCI7300277.1 RNA methyltransferase [Clostridia bacterium]MCU7378565.1 RNA methyltransferase [Hominibacterium faecale]MDY3010146.1 RNA methyltransferase [Clostridiales Family XIII bacterium]